MGRPFALLLLASGSLVGCGQAQTREAEGPPPELIYESVAYEQLDGDLVNVFIELRGAQESETVAQSAECAAIRYAVDEGLAYARHLRTNIHEKGGLWRADAIYSITSELPRGLKTIVAKDAVDDCAENEIPMV